ncbi:MAG TPA: glycosyltransferase [Solirubrobacterales bacterium]|nr:glycosyltransferase [Solirubrobacterales bacterium]
MSATAPLVQYWHEENLPDDVAETVNSFKEHNPELEQLVFDEGSAREFIATHRGAREVAAFDACGVPAMQADYLRYCAVHALGGVYADANFRCLQSLRGLIDGPEKGVLFGRRDPVPAWLAEIYRWPYPVGEFRAVPNGMFGFGDRHHPLLELAIEISTANIERRVVDGPFAVWIATGPGVFTSIYLLRELGSFDAFMGFSLGTVIEPSAALLCEVVDDCDRIASMWDGVDIRSLKDRDDLSVKLNGPPSEAHWLRRKGSIYR